MCGNAIYCRECGKVKAFAIQAMPDTDEMTNHLHSCHFGCGNFPCACDSEYQKWKEDKPVTRHYAILFVAYELKHGGLR
jgi:hypothetical protein